MKQESKFAVVSLALAHYGNVSEQVRGLPQVEQDPTIKGLLDWEGLDDVSKIAVDLVADRKILADHYQTSFDVSEHLAWASTEEDSDHRYNVLESGVESDFKENKLYRIRRTVESLIGFFGDSGQFSVDLDMFRSIAKGIIERNVPSEVKHFVDGISSIANGAAGKQVAGDSRALGLFDDMKAFGDFFWNTGESVVDNIHAMMKSAAFDDRSFTARYGWACSIAEMLRFDESKVDPYVFADICSEVRHDPKSLLEAILKVFEEWECVLRRFWLLRTPLCLAALYEFSYGTEDGPCHEVLRDSAIDTAVYDCEES